MYIEKNMKYHNLYVLFMYVYISSFSSVLLFIVNFFYDLILKLVFMGPFPIEYFANLSYHSGRFPSLSLYFFFYTFFWAGFGVGLHIWNL